YTQELESPDVVRLEGSSEVMRSRSLAHNGDMSNIQGPAFREFHQKDAVENEKKVVNNECEEDDKSVGTVRAHERDCCCHDQPGQSYSFRQPSNLRQRRQTRFGINTKGGQESGPSWKNDRQVPEVHSNGHHRVPFDPKQHAKSPIHKVRG